VWNDPDRAQALGQERAQLEKVVVGLDELTGGLNDAVELLDMAQEEEDEGAVTEIIAALDGFEDHVAGLEFRRMFSGEMDASNAYVDIQSGAGGTEAQDWAEMLLRMYLRWAEAHEFKAELIEASAGEVAGIKSATIKIDIDIDINPADLRIDVYRASGAGGQHVNRTESAVRITHLPTNTVVQCQNDRSQHKNKATAMKQLKAKLYELEMLERRAKASEVEAGKADVGWGSQIRSYVLDQSRIKDLRTNVETGNTQAVLDGGIDIFIEAGLKQGL